MPIVLRVIFIYFVPSVFGLMTAALLLFSYLKLGVVVQLEPTWLEILKLMLLFMSGVFNAVLLYKYLTWAKFYKIVIMLCLCLWTQFHALNVTWRALSYLGAGCCEEHKASLLNVIDSVANPFFPFIRFED